MSNAEDHALSCWAVAEQQLVKSLPAEKGRDLLKQVRTYLIETACPLMDERAYKATRIKVLSMHHDSSTATGEEVVRFALAASVDIRERRPHLRVAGFRPITCNY
jgi:uncharacterized protein YbcI